MNHLDTNALVRFIIGDIPEQASAVTDLLNAEGAIRISPVCLMETVFVLRKHYEIEKKHLIEICKTLISMPYFSAQKDFYVGVFDTWLAHSKLSFEDCLLAALAENDGGVLYTFDKALAKSANSAKLLV